MYLPDSNSDAEPAACAIADKISDKGLTASDLLWIEATLPAMSLPMTRLVVLLLLLDNTRLRKTPRTAKTIFDHKKAQ